MLKKIIRKKLEAIYDAMACDDPYEAICTTAGAAAAIVAVCPVGIDAWALRMAEVFMLVSIYAHYGVKLSTSMARTVMLSGFAHRIGEGAALAALEAANVAVVANPFLGYLIKSGIAVTLISIVGLITIKSLDGSDSPAAKDLVNAMCSIGLGGDLNRAITAVGNIGGIPSNTEYAAKLEEKIAKARENTEFGEQSLKNVYEDPCSESSGAYEMLAKKYWDKRLDSLVDAKSKL